MRIVRRLLIGLAVIPALIILFYVTVFLLILFGVIKLDLGAGFPGQ